MATFEMCGDNPFERTENDHQSNYQGREVLLMDYFQNDGQAMIGQAENYGLSEIAERNETSTKRTHVATSGGGHDNVTKIQITDMYAIPDASPPTRGSCDTGERINESIASPTRTPSLGSPTNSKQQQFQEIRVRTFGFQNPLRISAAHCNQPTSMT